MPKTDIARRVYNHTWKLDPIVRSLLDTDFYKLLMLQMIWGLYPKVEATFSLINRKHAVHLAEEIDEGELRAQLDHARTLRFTKKEMIWLAGNTFYGSKQIFQPGFLRWLENFQLPDYRLEKRDGQFILEFPGLWLETTMWEIPALAIINELRSRAAMKRPASAADRRRPACSVTSSRAFAPTRPSTCPRVTSAPGRSATASSPEYAERALSSSWFS